MDIRINQQLSHYKIIGEFDPDGEANIYEALDLESDQTVALKIIYYRPGISEREVERFTCISKVLSSLKNPFVGSFIELGETADSQFYLCMPCCHGESLKMRLKNANMKIDQAGKIAAQIAWGLSVAHKRNILHGDLKPSNIIITDEHTVKIVGFGESILTGENNNIYNQHNSESIIYKSPEQIQGEEIGIWTDIWTFGIIFYEMITGHTPFETGYHQATIYSILNEDPAPISNFCSSVPDNFAEIFSRCLEKRPIDRYESINHVISDLNNVDTKSKFHNQ